MLRAIPGSSPPAASGLRQVLRERRHLLGAASGHGSRGARRQGAPASRRASPRPRVVATGNPGCLMQIGAGLAAAGLDIRVAHPVELLDESYGVGECTGSRKQEAGRGEQEAGSGERGAGHEVRELAIPAPVPRSLFPFPVPYFLLSASCFPLPVYRSPMVSAILFDFNGVIIDDEPQHCDALITTLAESGHALDRDTYYAEYLGFDDRECFTVHVPAAGAGRRRWAVAAAMERKNLHYERAIRDSMRLVPGAEDFIENAALDGFQLAIVSGALRREVELVLDLAGLRPHFAEIVAAEDVDGLQARPSGLPAGAGGPGARAQPVCRGGRLPARTGGGAGCRASLRVLTTSHSAESMAGGQRGLERLRRPRAGRPAVGPCLSRTSFSIARASTGCAAARQALTASGLRGVEVAHGDAGLTDAYAGMVPADLLLLCGVFGNVADEDVENTAANASRLCAPQPSIWTRHRRAPDLTPRSVAGSSAAASRRSRSTRRTNGRSPWAPSGWAPRRCRSSPASASPLRVAGAALIASTVVPVRRLPSSGGRGGARRSRQLRQEPGGR